MESSIHHLNKLNIQSESLEKSLNSILLILKRYNVDILDEFEAIKKNREVDREEKTNKLRELLGNIRRKSELVRNGNFRDSSDFKQFKKDMISIQETIQTLKVDTKIQLKKLNEEYLEIAEDVNYYNTKVAVWSEPVRLNIFCNLEPIKPKTVKCRNHQKEVKEFLDFVHCSGGHENGWRKEDHHLFLRHRKKYKDIHTLAQSLHEILPDISIEEIVEHEEWFKKYLHLEKCKKYAITAWKTSKRNSNTTAVLQTTDEDKPSLICHVIQRKTVYEQLIKWKEERENKMRNAKEIELYKQQRKREQEEMWRKKNYEMKMIVQEWKNMKIASEQEDKFKRIMQEKAEKKMRGLEANKLIKQFQSQDDMYIAKVKQLKKREECRLPVRSRSSHVAKKDPARLMRPTKQWINRVHDDNDYTAVFPHATLPLNKLPKLHVPEWRRSENKKLTQDI